LQSIRYDFVHACVASREEKCRKSIVLHLRLVAPTLLRF